MCHRNCFKCPYADCVVESASEAEMSAQRIEDREILIERLKGVKGAKAALKRYNLSEKGRARVKKYLESEKGRAMLKRRTQTKIKNGKNAEYCRKYYQRRKERNELRNLQSAEQKTILCPGSHKRDKTAC